MNAQIETDLTKLNRAITRLEEVMSWPDSHDGRVEAAIQCLEFVVELYWKLLKHMLYHEGIPAQTPREVFREAFTAGRIGDEDIWLRMLRDRNLSSHTYNEDLAQEILGRIPDYLPVIRTTFEALNDRAEQEDQK